jgi:hypothetical protein
MSPPPATSTIPPGIDVDALRDDLAPDGVAVPPGTDPAPLTEVVAQARQDGLGLAVVVLSGDVDPGDASELAESLRGGGTADTVLVLSGDGLGASSTRVSPQEIGAAIDVALARPDEAGIAETFAEELTGTGLPWGLVVTVVVAVIAVGALLVRLRERRGQAARDVAALVAEGARVRAEIAALAPRVVAYEPRIPLSPDPALDADFDRLGIDYAALAEDAGPDPADRPAVEALRVRLADIVARLDDIGSRLDGTP